MEAAEEKRSRVDLIRHLDTRRIHPVLSHKDARHPFCGGIFIAEIDSRGAVGELDGVISNVSSMGESMTELDTKVTEMMSSTGLVIDVHVRIQWRKLHCRLRQYLDGFIRIG